MNELLPVLLKAILLAGVGGVLAAAFQDEKNVLKLLVLGAAAPGLINSWAAYGTASGASINQERLKELPTIGGSQNLPTPAKPAPPRGSLYLPFDANLLPTVYAASEIPLKTFSRSNGSLVEQIQGVFTGVVQNRDYFVIAGSFASLEEAQQRRVTVAAKLVGRDVNVYNPIQGPAPPLYSVVVAPNLPFDEAKRVLAEVSKAGFPSAYIWTFGVALRQWMPCVTTTVKERTWTLVTLQGIDHPITLATGQPLSC